MFELNSSIVFGKITKQVLFIFLSILSSINTIAQTIEDYNNVKLAAVFSKDTSEICSKKHLSVNMTNQIDSSNIDNTPIPITLVSVGDSLSNKKIPILTLGDSNGTFNYGWPQQLKNEIPYADIFNISKSGKTIGFNNNGDSTLNQLVTLDNDLLKANNYIGSGEYDYIVIGLGTNDAKYDFRSKQNEVYANLERLIKRLQSCQYKSLNRAKIVIKSPTPYGIKSQSQSKYSGGNDRVKEMNAKFRKIAKKYHCIFVDTFTPLYNDIETLSNDGLHLNAEGQKKIADLIAIGIKTTY